MSHKNFIVSLSLSVLAIGIGASSINNLKVNAVTANDWAPLAGSAITIEDIDNGVKLTNTSGYGQRAYFKDKVLVDGLSFDWKVNEFVQGECRGFSFHNGSDPWSYFTETGSAVFAYWGVFDQNRLYVMPNHDYNNNATTTLAVNAKNSETKDMSSAGGLVCNYTSSFSLNFKFEKDGDDWYKVTITGSQVWGDPNYNVTTGTAGNSAVTYISKENMHVDEYGRAYMITMAMDKKATDDSVEFLNMNYVNGISVKTAPTKVEYQMGDELNIEGGEINLNYVDGTTKAVAMTKDMISGFDSSKEGKNTITLSYNGFTTTLDLTINGPTAEAKSFANSYLDKLGTVCKADGSSNLDELKSVWSEMNTSFSSLSDDAKALLKNGTANAASADPIERFLERYEYIGGKYGNSLVDTEDWNFIGRSTSVLPSSLNNRVISSDNTLAIIIVISAVLLSITGIVVIRKFKTKEN